MSTAEQRLFKAHLEEAPFQSGCDAGKWALHGDVDDIVWPHPVFWVQSDLQFVPAGKIHLRFTVDGYPTSAPTSCPWDVKMNSKLDLSKWPRVPGKFARVFRTDWNGAVALYAPCDRVAMSGHDQWRPQFPSWWWQSHFTIVKYLEFVHMVLNPVHF